MFLATYISMFGGKGFSLGPKPLSHEATLTYLVRQSPGPPWPSDKSPQRAKAPALPPRATPGARARRE